MPREWTLRVQDMREAIVKIERYTAGLTVGHNPPEPAAHDPGAGTDAGGGE